MATRQNTDALISNAVVSGSPSFLPKFQGGLANLFSEYISSQMQLYSETHEKHPDQQYVSRSCNNVEDENDVGLCASTNTLGR